LAEITNEEKWSERIQEYRNSKLSAVAFCKANDYSISTLKYWINKLNTKSKKSESTDWICLSKSSIAESHPPITIKAEKFSIEIPDGFNAATLKNILIAIRNMHD
jgi:hypothetical protein